MSIKTFLTTIALVAGTSSAAMARPYEFQRPMMRSYRMQRWAPHRYVRRTYQRYQPSYQNSQNSQFFPLGGTIGSGNEIELGRGEDQAFVDQLIIHYADGRDVPMHLDRSLSAYSPELQLQTENCAINGVTVIGSGAVTAERI
jgi:hypothetical protein